MLSGAVLKQFRTYLKSQVGHGWSVEGRKSKGRLLTRVSFRYLTGERSVVLLEIDFDADNQDDILRTVKKLSDLMRERNILNCRFFNNIYSYLSTFDNYRFLNVIFFLIKNFHNTYVLILLTNISGPMGKLIQVHCQIYK